MTGARDAARLALVALVGAAIPVGIDLIWVRPLGKEALAQKKRQCDAGRKDLRALGVTANKLDEFKRDDARLHENLATLEEIRPPEPRLDPLFDRLQTICHAKGLEVEEVKRLPLVQDTAPFELRLRGKYAAFVSFMEHLPHLARLTRVDRIEVDRRNPAEFEFRVRISAFYWKGYPGGR